MRAREQNFKTQNPKKDSNPKQEIELCRMVREASNLRCPVQFDAEGWRCF